MPTNIYVCYDAYGCFKITNELARKLKTNSNYGKAWFYWIRHNTLYYLDETLSVIEIEPFGDIDVSTSKATSIEIGDEEPSDEE